MEPFQISQVPPDSGADIGTDVWSAIYRDVLATESALHAAQPGACGPQSIASVQPLDHAWPQMPAIPTPSSPNSNASTYITQSDHHDDEDQQKKREKRRAQNRESQRNFRERAQRRYKNLEHEIATLSTNLSTSKSQNDALVRDKQRLVRDLKKASETIDALRTVIQTRRVDGVERSVRMALEAPTFNVASNMSSVTDAALEGMCSVVDDLRNLKQSSKALEKLATRTGAIEARLPSLKALGERQWDALGSIVAEQYRNLMMGCICACRKLASSVRESQRMLSPTRTTDGMFEKLGQSQMRTLMEHFRCCECSVENIVAVAALYGSGVTDEAEQLSEHVRQRVGAAIAATRKRQIVTESRLEDLECDDSDDENGCEDEHRAGTVERLRAVQRSLDGCQQLLEELMVKSNWEVVTKTDGLWSLTDSLAHREIDTL